jgi:peptide/nickel transport system substrate-binding protein
VLSFAVSRCRGGSDEGGGEDGQPGAVAEDGGVLRLGVPTDLSPTVVFSNTAEGTNTLIGLVYDSLVDYDKDSLEPKPALATSWKLAPDGKSLTLKLRDDVAFHSGRKFTSKDVEFSIKNTFADPTWAVQLQRTAAAITSYDTSKPDEITLGFDQPLSNIFDLLDMVPIVDSETFDQLKEGKAYVGTGPFEFKSWQPGSKMEFTANKDYWGGAPHLDGVEVSVITDANAEVSQLRAGQLDAIVGGSNRDLESLKDSGKFNVEPYEGAESQEYVGANVDNPALKDVRLRQAIAYAVDRDRILDEVYRGVGRANSLAWPTYYPAYDKELDQYYQRDVAKAKDLVAQVGGDIPVLPLGYPAGNPNLEATAQIVQANLEEVGIKTKLEPVEQAQFIQQLITGKFEALWILTHGYAQYTPSTLAVSAYPFNADKNASHFSSPAYSKDSLDAWHLTDPNGAEAKSVYERLSKDLLDNAFLIELVTTYQQVSSSKAVHDIAWSKRGELDLSDTYLAD